MRKYVYFFSVFMIFISCAEDKNPTNYVYRMVNNSGHEIAMVTENIDANIPDSVVIENNGMINWSHPYLDYVFNPFNYKYSIKIYYDRIIHKIYSHLDHLNRNPIYQEYWIMEEKKDNTRLMIFTFTEEDYLRAVEENQQE